MTRFLRQQLKAAGLLEEHTPNPELKQVERLDDMAGMTKCWACVNAVPSADGSRGCPWSRGLHPVPGWHAEKDEKTGSYLVVGCPQFVADCQA